MANTNIPSEKNDDPNNGLSTGADGDLGITKMDDPPVDSREGAFSLNFWQTLLPSRFQIIKALGKGLHGKVLLARDSQLGRLVAIKISFQESNNNPKVSAAIQDEARVLASLDHPNIVPIFDVGKNGQAWFIVSKFLEGGTLSQSIREKSYTPTEISNLISAIALALQYSHDRGLVHLDVKPDNILLDQNGDPILVDFGLAIRDGVGHAGKNCPGTPAYMSPEQANGEGHRIDGRSDIFSLGIILYELLTGRRPFEGKTIPETLEKVSQAECVPPSRINPTVNKELERICLKALCKRKSDRFSTAKSMVDELVEFMESVPVKPGTGGRLLAPAYKGLRAYDQGDAEFFLEMLPGPKDREGFPGIVRFWLNHMSAQDEATAVNVIYGPSGCGKSSLVKAGILPRLADHILPVYLESTAEKTEATLLSRLQAHYSSCAGLENLADAFSTIRKLSQNPGAKKVVVVLDQFEQWLLPNQDLEHSGLLQALRQADGLHLQVILVVRDDFMLGVNRLMGLLDISLVEGKNFSLVDLFDCDHSIKVLEGIGRSLGKLPGGELDPGQKEFVEKAVMCLAVEGRGIPVRLAMFSEMMKSRDWNLSSLELVGGLEGLGMHFFEETLGARSGGGDRQQVAQSILEALLPAEVTQIKGGMVALDQLRDLAGNKDNPEVFSEVIHWLDKDLRLITPVMQEESGPGNGGYYILAHDYLVPALQEWLAIKKKGTAGGKAWIKLTDLVSLWSLEKEKRHLPSLLEYMAISRHVPEGKRTPIQAQMMKCAKVHHAKRTLVFGVMAAVLLTVYLWQSQENHERTQEIKARSLADQLLVAEGNTLAKALLISDKNLGRVGPMLRAELASIPANDARRGRAILALLPLDKGFLEEATHNMLEASPVDFLVYRDRLRPWKESLVEEMGRIAREPGSRGEKGQLRAMGAVAAWDRGRDMGKGTLANVLEKLLNQNQLFVPEWVSIFAPMQSQILPLLIQWATDREKPSNQRDFAAAMACNYAATDDQKLFQLLVGVECRNAGRIMEKILPVRASMADHLREILAIKKENMGFEERKGLAIEQGVAAAVLISQNEPAGFSIFFDSPDPTARTAAQNILPFLGVGPKFLLNRIQEEKDPKALAGMVIALGDFDPLSLDSRPEWQDRILSMYEKHPDASLHGALDWLLRKKWGLGERCDGIDRSLMGNADKNKNWVVNSQGQTFVKIPGPSKFYMGSASDEPVRFDPERRHLRTIPRSFSLGMKEVTVRDFLKLLPNQKYIPQYSKTPDSPMNCVSWFCAAEYCNMLTEKEFTKADCCYIPNEKGQYGHGMTMAPNFLQKKGYRLPTEAEWEYCCKAGTMSSYFFGNDVSMLDRFAFYQGNSKNYLWPVGTLRPNNLGFFDMAGNAFEWLQDKYLDYPPGDSMTDAKIDMDLVDRLHSRSLRNGGFYNPAGSLRSANRNGAHAEDITNSRGFRIARTLD